MVKETLARRVLQAKISDEMDKLEEDLSKIAVRQGQSRFLAAYKDGDNAYLVTIGFHYSSELVGEGERIVYMTLKAKTLGEGELKPSSIPALAEIIDRYRFREPED